MTIAAAQKVVSAPEERQATAPRRVLSCAAPGVLLAALVLLPFGGKAFTIDDTLFLEQATHVLSDPLHPTAFETVWSEAPVAKRVSQIMPSGPVAAWLLVPTALAGGGEWVAHLTVLAAFALAIVATVAVALRLGLSPRASTRAGLLLAATPAALGMAGTAMPDVFAMALGVAGLERIAAWKSDRRAHQAIAAAVLLGLAPLARTHVVLLLVVAALLVAGDHLGRPTWRKERWSAWAPVLAAPVVTVAVAVLTRDPAGSAGDLAASAQTFSAVGYLAVNTVAFAAHWVLALPLAVPWIVARPSMLRRWWVPVGSAAAALGALAVSPFGPTRFPYVVSAVAGIGAAVLVDVLTDAWRRRDSTQLTLGLWLLVALPVAAYLHMPSKYLLASAPAAALLVARALERAPVSVARWATGGAVAAGVALGIAILSADSSFADIGRRAAGELIAPNAAAGRRVWFTGAWGFKWYASRAGARILTVTPPYPLPGDLVVTTRRSEPSPPVLRMLAGRYPRITPLARIEDREPGGRVMDAAAGAGFYSNAWGYLPWAWGDDPLDTFELWRVDAE
jgi:hypothetical protein